MIFREACYYLSPSGSDNLVSGIDAAVACGLMADGARLAVTFSNSEFCAVKNAIGFQENEDGTGRLWMGNFGVYLNTLYKYSQYLKYFKLLQNFSTFSCFVFHSGYYRTASDASSITLADGRREMADSEFGTGTNAEKVNPKCFSK